MYWDEQVTVRSVRVPVMHLRKYETSSIAPLTSLPHANIPKGEEVKVIKTATRDA